LVGEELIEQVLGWCRAGDPKARRYIARALAEARPAFLARRTVFREVCQLRVDEDSSVATAAAAIRLPSALQVLPTRCFEAIAKLTRLARSIRGQPRDRVRAG
jgi:hypothetical protein